MNQKREYATYYVALKILLKKGDEFLFLKDAKNCHFDQPGGRIDNVEHKVSLIEILGREIREELGEDVKYKLGRPLFQFRRHWDDKGVHIFLTVYSGEYISGNIKLSDEHSGYEWINPRKSNFKHEDFFNEEEYLAFQKYFNETII